MTSDTPLIACHDCDLLQREVIPPRGAVAVCPRCGAEVARGARYTHQHALALCFATVIVFIIANLFPIIGIESQGNRNASTLLGAVHTLWHDKMPIVAGLVFVTTFLAPAVELALLIWLLSSTRPSPLGLRIVLATQPWRMIEVFMLGLLVSVVKLSHLATIVPGVALWCFAAMLPLFALITTNFNLRDLWDAIPVQGQHHA